MFDRVAIRACAAESISSTFATERPRNGFPGICQCTLMKPDPPLSAGHGMIRDINAAILSVAFSGPSPLAVLTPRAVTVALTWPPLVCLLTLGLPFHALNPFRRATRRFHARTRRCSQDLASQAAGIGVGVRDARCCSRAIQSFQTLVRCGCSDGGRQMLDSV